MGGLLAATITTDMFTRLQRSQKTFSQILFLRQFKRLNHPLHYLRTCKDVTSHSTVFTLPVASPGGGQSARKSCRLTLTINHNDLSFISPRVLIQ
jgi:hypothetical protein